LQQIYARAAKIGKNLNTKVFSGNAQIQIFVNKKKMARNKIQGYVKEG
jgi:hypothetical protein